MYVNAQSKVTIPLNTDKYKIIMFSFERPKQIADPLRKKVASGSVGFHHSSLSHFYFPIGYSTCLGLSLFTLKILLFPLKVKKKKADFLGRLV